MKGFSKPRIFLALLFAAFGFWCVFRALADEPGGASATLPPQSAPVVAVIPSTPKSPAQVPVAKGNARKGGTDLALAQGGKGTVGSNKAAQPTKHPGQLAGATESMGILGLTDVQVKPGLGATLRSAFEKPQGPEQIVVQPGQTLILEVPGLKQRCQGTRPEQLYLLLDGKPFKHLGPGTDSLPEDRVSFDLKVPDGPLGDWQPLFEHPTQSRFLTIALGLDGEMIAKTDHMIKFQVVPAYRWRNLKVGLGFAAALIILLCAWTPIVRTSAFEKGRALNRGDNNFYTRLVNGRDLQRPYSLALCQMAWWFFLVFGAYCAIFYLTGHAPAMNTTILTLLGISVFTNGGATIADTNSRKQLDTAAAAAKQVGPAGSPTLQGAKGAAKPQPQANSQPSPGSDLTPALYNAEGKSFGFFADLFSDLDGSIKLHRFQMVVWTVVLGIMFCVKVKQTLTMPEFPGDLLTLMGISSGAYVGLKIPVSNGK